MPENKTTRIPMLKQVQQGMKKRHSRNLTHATISRNITSLEEKGYVRRVLEIIKQSDAPRPLLNVSEQQVLQVLEEVTA